MEGDHALTQQQPAADPGGLGGGAGEGGGEGPSGHDSRVEREPVSSKPGALVAYAEPPAKLPLWKRILRSNTPGKRCPHCRETLPIGQKGDCPLCGRALATDDGKDLRPLDLDFDKRLAEMDERAIANTWKGAAVAAALCLVLPLPPFSWIGAPLIIILQLLWVRIAIVAPYRRHFGMSRRIVTRWITRLAVASGATFHAPAALGGVGTFNFLVTPILFAALCAGAWQYHRWHLKREKDHLPVAWFETVLLWLLIFVFLAVVAAVILLIVLLDSMIA